MPTAGCQENRAREEDGDVGLRSGIDIRPASGLQCIKFLPSLDRANCGLVVISPRSRTVLNASISDTRSAADKKVYAPVIYAVIVPNGPRPPRFMHLCDVIPQFLLGVCRPSTYQPVLSGPLLLRATERRSVPILRNYRHLILLSPHGGSGFRLAFQP